MQTGARSSGQESAKRARANGKFRTFGDVGERSRGRPSGDDVVGRGAGSLAKTSSRVSRVSLRTFWRDDVWCRLRARA